MKHYVESILAVDRYRDPSTGDLVVESQADEDWELVVVYASVSAWAWDGVLDEYTVRTDEPITDTEREFALEKLFDELLQGEVA